ncbi:MAG: nucleoside monophosphate kinase [Bacteroidota bacterium]|jgi:adenylate kinase|nr:nucleoside monophosphate kinase [Bacteroidota bacterium]NLP19428.1 AAA family ATPase [Bacteroidales bacterium]OQC45581.1 MAG: Adenylate kinase [Bacteroidetes bacterium ADurb.Bin028]HNY43571.1 nucleoside monophosphate kinase [Bacteroidales bacterium]HOD88274.1 nucleoside monophosphate kinase [Bacteroidales bacterium]
MKIAILAGPPGSGKSTHSKLLAEKLGFVHISTGNIFRKEIEKNTDLGKLAQSLIDKGNFVPDEIVCEMIEKIITTSDENTKFVFDGFPRNYNQAVEFEKILEKLNLKVNVFLEFNVCEDSLISRLIERSKSSNRKDDSDVRIIKHRLEVYKNNTHIINDFYFSRTNCFKINGDRPISVVSAEIFEIVNKFMS